MFENNLNENLLVKKKPLDSEISVNFAINEAEKNSANIDSEPVQ